MGSVKPLHLPVLTGLRFVAAGAVLIAHALHAVFQNASPSVHAFALQLAYLALTLFFVLSGCVLMVNYADSFVAHPGLTLRNFWASRIARLYPLYLFCALLYLAFGPLTLELFLKVLPWDLFLVQTWTFSWTGNAPRALYFFPYAWSISVEMFFYLIFPFFVFVLQKSRSFLVDGFIFFVLYAFSMVTLLQAYHSIMTHGHATWCGIQIISPAQFLQWLSYYSPYSHLSSFLAGCIVGKYLTARAQCAKSRAPGLWLPLLTVVFISIFLFVTPPDSQRLFKLWDLPKHGMLYAPVIALFVYTLCRHHNPTTRFLSNRFSQFFGETSYSIYLLHPMIAGLFLFGLSAGQPVSFFDPSRWLRFFVIIVFTLVASYGTYALIETPGRKWLRRRLMARGQSLAH